MTLDQEKMIEELVDNLTGTDYFDLKQLAIDAYNKAIEDAEKYLNDPDKPYPLVDLKIFQNG